MHPPEVPCCCHPARESDSKELRHHRDAVPVRHKPPLLAGFADECLWLQPKASRRRHASCRLQPVFEVVHIHHKAGLLMCCSPRSSSTLVAENGHTQKMQASQTRTSTAAAFLLPMALKVLQEHVRPLEFFGQASLRPACCQAWLSAPQTLCY